MTMKELNTTKPYCNAAIFTCSCCGYSTTIYTDFEWVVIDKDSFEDNRAGENAILAFIYRDDISIHEPLHPQAIYTPLSKYNYTFWNVPSDLKIHWTEQTASCPKCKNDSMVFAEYTIGENMLWFYKKCANDLKLAYPSMLWFNEDGTGTYIVGNGNGDKFSAT
jgi:hypothetical protein